MNWDFEDRNNDWLADEMRREGYDLSKHQPGGTLKKAHAMEERSSGWNIGALANKREHEIAHQNRVQRNQLQQVDKMIVGIVTLIAIMILMYVISHLL